MALARCKNCKIRRNRETFHPEPVKPVGYPYTAAVCGIPGCEEPGLVHLKHDEFDAYEQGNRVFSVPNNAIKVRVE